MKEYKETLKRVANKMKNNEEITKDDVASMVPLQVINYNHLEAKITGLINILELSDKKIKELDELVAKYERELYDLSLEKTIEEFKDIVKGYDVDTLNVLLEMDDDLSENK